MLRQENPPRDPLFRPVATPAMLETKATMLRASEQELHILRRELLHARLIVVDGAVDHVGFLLLKHDHTRLHRVFDAQASDDTRPLLTDAVTAVSGLPFSCWVPPSANMLARVDNI